MAIVISGKELAKNKKMKMKEEVEAYYSLYGRFPHLAVVLVGEDQGVCLMFLARKRPVLR